MIHSPDGHTTSRRLTPVCACACSQVAKTLQDRRMLDVARVNLGIARGCVRTGRYMDVVANDLTSLLQWKNIRMPLDAF